MADEITTGVGLGLWDAFQVGRVCLLFWLFKILAQDSHWHKVVVWLGALVLAWILAVGYGDPSKAPSSSSGDEEEDRTADSEPEKIYPAAYVQRHSTEIFTEVFVVAAVGILSARKPNAENL